MHYSLSLSLFDSEEVNSSTLLYSSSPSLLQLPRPISCFTLPHSIRLSKFYTNYPSNFHTINTANEKSSNFHSNFHKLIFQTKNPVTFTEIFTQLIFQIKIHLYYQIITTKFYKINPKNHRKQNFFSFSLIIDDKRVAVGFCYLKWAALLCLVVEESREA